MKMSKYNLVRAVWVVALGALIGSCKVPSGMVPREERKATPTSYQASADTTNTAAMKWKDFFTDPNLVQLIDSALARNQELNIILQEINIARNEVRARKGEYLPFVGVAGSASVDKAGRYTRNGAIDESVEIKPGSSNPNPLPNYQVAAYASWQVDIWKKLRNAKKAAMLRYLATTEGKNFMVTQLVAEIASSYYELMALDNQLEILRRNIQIQQDALEIVRLEKLAAKTTELAIRRFEAEVLKNKSRIYYISQQITQTENRINFLVGRFPQHVIRSATPFTDLVPAMVSAGIPSQLLHNRPDIRQAEFDLMASKLDVTVARANFYPSFNITAAIGLEALNGKDLFTSPESMLYNFAGGLVAPLINRNALKAMYFSANARQIQAVFNYERSILGATVEVANQLANINNLQQSYQLRSEQVQALTESIDISVRLFKSARADYMEVLLTQRDALESKFELVENRKQQMNAMVHIYQALGGGWN